MGQIIEHPGRNAPQAEPPRIGCIGFTPSERPGPLIGWASFHVPKWRARLYGCAVFRNDGWLSVALPNRPRIDGEGRVRRDGSGKQVYDPTIEFDDPATGRFFSDEAVRALVAYRPELATRE